MTYDSKHTEILDPKTGYDAVADQYGRYHNHLNTFYHLNFLSFLPRKDSFDIIDLWAGDGRMFRELNQIPHWTYIALDVSKEMLLHHPRGVKHLVADLEKKLPLSDKSFDVAVSFFTTEHLEHISNFFSEVYRILKPEGKLFIGHFFQRRTFVWNANKKTFKIQQFKRTTEELQQEAEKADFQVNIIPLYDKADHTGDLIICTP